MVGKSGRTAVWDQLPGLISDFKLDFVIVNEHFDAAAAELRAIFVAQRLRRPDQAQRHAALIRQLLAPL